MTQVDAGGEARPTPRLGRRRDHTRDPEILEAALDVLAETGYDGMTIDMVATRAKAGKATLYRRWSSKAELVLEAVAHMKRPAPAAELPDTGTLRGDLLGMIRPPTIRDGERKLKVMAGLVSMLARTPELAEAAHEAVTEPRAAAYRTLLRRAIDRGEIPADVDVERLALVVPSLVAYRVLMARTPADEEFLRWAVEHVLLPAAGVRAGA
ncbi:TetR/AcrR family transcriptional regulator [Promicromonospora citrea]|uniref:TetR family transcriptional regulator n=1 Tax=Promicromonospora citrea TaxID=43677 RepID=A0A8H9GT80_9MICO|nr:TetR/AcrR family transcriptional regulator [Promicromonospora citrea]NNH51349.1 TetR/AcrR family transcriptional regulator [Promicromonospora citrea]GGM41412.1 TetR family transcriptional regulator [Promicromonospora citrea]